MTKDVIELAREAGLSHRNVHSGLEHCNLDDDEDLTPALIKFAALVAARERERCEKAVENSSSCFTSDQAYIKKLAVAAIRALNTEGPDAAMAQKGGE